MHDPGRTSRSRSLDASDATWQVVRAVGLTLLLMGAVDLGLAVVPPRIGNTEWEFATISALLNGLPVPAMGAALVLAASIELDSTSGAVVIAGWSLVVAVLLCAAVTLYVLDVPLALRAVQDAAAQRGLKSAIIKSLTAFFAYFALHVYLVRKAAQFLRRGNQ